MEFYNTGGLSNLLEKKTSEEEKKKIIIAQEAIALIHHALNSKNSSCKLSEEMDNLEMS